MGRLSTRFEAALRQSHTLYEYVDIITPSNVTTHLSVTVGTVTADRSAQFRRSAQVTCFDPTGTLTPSTAKSALTPFGTVMRAYSGIQYTDGTTEVYPLGVFRLSEVDVTESSPTSASGLSISITAYDLSRTISRNKFTTAYVIPAGTLVVSAIKTLVYRTFPEATFDSIDHTMTTPYALAYAAGDDPWQACIDLALSIGCDVYFDVNGQVVVAPPADIQALSSPVFGFIEGDGNTMTDITAIYTDDPGYNGVIVIGASTGTGATAVQGSAWDNNPGSPTYQYGPYGQVPQIVNDTNITTVAAANAAAASLLNSMLGFVTQTDITTWTNPALEIDDVVQVERARVSATGSYIVDMVTIPMGSSATGTPAGVNSQSVTLRQMRQTGA